MYRTRSEFRLAANDASSVIKTNDIQFTLRVPPPTDTTQRRFREQHWQSVLTHALEDAANVGRKFRTNLHREWILSRNMLRILFVEEAEPEPKSLCQIHNYSDG
jgi:hypothetical protein